MCPYGCVGIVVGVVAVVRIVIGVFVVDHTGISFGVQGGHILRGEFVLRKHLIHIALHSSAIGTS